LNILKKYHDILVNNLKEIYGKSLNPNISLEFPKDPSMGDISTNAVMILTKELSLEKDKLTKDVTDIFYKTGDFKTINVVGSGFINLIFKDFHADFLKRAEDDVHFVCEDGIAIQNLVRDAEETGERQNLSVQIVATVPKISDEPVAKFILTLSIKKKSK